MTAGCKCTGPECTSVTATLKWELAGPFNASIKGCEDFDCAEFADGVCADLNFNFGPKTHWVERNNQTRKELDDDIER